MGQSIGNQFLKKKEKFIQVCIQLFTRYIHMYLAEGFIGYFAHGNRSYDWIGKIDIPSNVINSQKFRLYDVIRRLPFFHISTIHSWTEDHFSCYIRPVNAFFDEVITNPNWLIDPLFIFYYLKTYRNLRVQVYDINAMFSREQQLGRWKTWICFATS